MDKLQSVLVEGFNAMTKKELMALAQEENIRGRSRMTKDELIQALLYANAA